MESQQQTHANNDQTEAGNVNLGGKNQAAGYVCRQSSSRWTPTTDQIRILKELYYNSGVRSPTAEQIQRISHKLRQYGKIEGKNVFYWFQNHKARERQKKRFTAASPDHHIIHARPPPPSQSWRNEAHDVCSHVHNKYTLHNIPPAGGFSSSSTPSNGLLNMASVGKYGYGSVAMEKSFRECSITPPPPPGSGTSSMAHNFASIGVNDAYVNSVPYAFLEKRSRYINDEQTLEYYLDDQEGDHFEEEAPEIETLPLFPMHEDGCLKHQQGITHDYFNGLSWSHGLNSEESSIGNGPRASLELTLNSYLGGN